MRFLIIIAVTMVFSIGTNISAYAQMPEGAGISFRWWIALRMSKWKK